MTAPIAATLGVCMPAPMCTGCATHNISIRKSARSQDLALRTIERGWRAIDSDRQSHALVSSTQLGLTGTMQNAAGGSSAAAFRGLLISAQYLRGHSVPRIPCTVMRP